MNLCLNLCKGGLTWATILVESNVGIAVLIGDRCDDRASYLVSSSCLYDLNDLEMLY